MVTAWGALPLAIFGVALAFRGRPNGRILLAITFVSISCLDVWLICEASAEGLDYLWRAWSQLPFGFALWCLWLLIVARLPGSNRMGRGRGGLGISESCSFDLA